MHAGFDELADPFVGEFGYDLMQGTGAADGTEIEPAQGDLDELYKWATQQDPTTHIQTEDPSGKIAGADGNLPGDSGDVQTYIEANENVVAEPLGLDAAADDAFGGDPVGLGQDPTFATTKYIDDKVQVDDTSKPEQSYGKDPLGEDFDNEFGLKKGVRGWKSFWKKPAEKVFEIGVGDDDDDLDDISESFEEGMDDIIDEVEANPTELRNALLPDSKQPAPDLEPEQKTTEVTDAEAEAFADLEFGPSRSRSGSAWSSSEESFITMEAAHLAMQNLKRQGKPLPSAEQLGGSMEDVLNENPSFWRQMKRAYGFLKKKAGALFKKSPSTHAENELEMEEFRRNAVKDLREPLLEEIQEEDRDISLNQERNYVPPDPAKDKLVKRRQDLVEELNREENVVDLKGDAVDGERWREDEITREIADIDQELALKEASGTRGKPKLLSAETKEQIARGMKEAFNVNETNVEGFAQEVGTEIMGGSVWMSKAGLQKYILKQAMGLPFAIPIGLLTNWIDTQAPGAGTLINMGLALTDLALNTDPLGLAILGIVKLVGGFADNQRRTLENDIPDKAYGTRFGYVRSGDKWMPAILESIEPDDSTVLGFGAQHSKMRMRYGDELKWVADGSGGWRPEFSNARDKEFIVTDQIMKESNGLGTTKDYRDQYAYTRDWYFMSADESHQYLTDPSTFKPIQDEAPTNVWTKVVNDWRLAMHSMDTYRQSDEMGTDAYDPETFGGMNRALDRVMTNDFTPQLIMDAPDSDDGFYVKKVLNYADDLGADVDNFLLNSVFNSSLDRLYQAQYAAAKEQGFDAHYATGTEPTQAEYRGLVPDFDLAPVHPTDWSVLYLDTSKDLPIAQDAATLQQQLDTISGYNDRTALQQSYLSQKAIVRYWMNQIAGNSMGGTNQLNDWIYDEYTLSRYSALGTRPNSKIRAGTANLRWLTGGDDTQAHPWMNAGENILPDMLDDGSFSKSRQKKNETRTQEMLDQTSQFIKDKGGVDPNLLLQGYEFPLGDGTILTSQRSDIRDLVWDDVYQMYRPADEVGNALTPLEVDEGLPDLTAEDKALIVAQLEETDDGTTGDDFFNFDYWGEDVDDDPLHPTPPTPLEIDDLPDLTAEDKALIAQTIYGGDLLKWVTQFGGTGAEADHREDPPTDDAPFGFHKDGTPRKHPLRHPHDEPEEPEPDEPEEPEPDEPEPDEPESYWDPDHTPTIEEIQELDLTPEEKATIAQTIYGGEPLSAWVDHFLPVVADVAPDEEVEAELHHGYMHETESSNYIPFTPELMHAVEMFELYDGHIPESLDVVHHIKPPPDESPVVHHIKTI